jgi:cobalamin synthase
MGIVSIVFYVGLTIVSAHVLADSIAAVGLMIAFYYGMTGFACVWFYRRTLTDNRRDFFMRGVLPFLGGLILLLAFIKACFLYADPNYGNTTLFGIGGVFVLGIGALLVGVVLMVVYNGIAPAFFRGETMRRDVGDLVLAGEGDIAYTGLPDSGLPGTVISPDLSNLPPGAQVEEPGPAEEP